MERQQFWNKQDAEWSSWASNIDERVVSAPEENVLHAGRNRVVCVQRNEQLYVVKAFRNAGWKKKLSYKWRSSKARRSYENGVRLQEAGVHTPAPIGWIEDWKNGWLERAYSISEMFAYEWRAWELKEKASVPDRDGELYRLGQAVARMHKAGMIHLDLTPGNVLLQPQESGPCVISFIDCNRMYFGTVDVQRGIKSLVQLGYEGDCIQPYLAGYCKERDIDEELALRLYTVFLKRHFRKWWWKNSTRRWRRKIGF